MSPAKRRRLNVEFSTLSRNPDKSIRQLEREYVASGDPRTWLQLQQKRRRAFLPYERAYIVKQRIESDEDEIETLWENEDLHGYRLAETILSNGWKVETWYDSNPTDDQDFYLDEIGWTTIVDDSIPDQVGMAIHCGGDDGCATRCHQRQVESIIDGTIEGYGGSWPLIDAEPSIIRQNPRRNWR